MYFFYHVWASEFDEMNAVVVTQSDPEGNENLLWSLHGVSYWNWQYTNVEIEPGILRINFKIIGRMIVGGFDNITLRDGTCEENEEIGMFHISESS